MKRISAYIFIPLAAAAFLAGGYFLRNYFEGRKPAPENFVAMTKIAPLFYSPEVDTAAWIRETKELERLGSIMNRMYRDLRARGAVNEPYASRYETFTPYPTTFLSAVPDVIRKTDAFFDHPTERSAGRLLKAYRKAAAAYRRDAERFAGLAQSAAENNPDGQLVFLGSATTPRIIANDAALLLKNADALEYEIAKRTLCLRGRGCEVNVKKSRIDTRPPVTVPSLPDVKKYYAAMQTADVRGPFFYPSRCWHNENGSPVWELLYLYFSPNTAGERAIYAKLATENYYSRVQPGTRNTLLQAFVDAGLDFFSTNESNPYRCTDLDYWQALPTMAWLRESLAAVQQLDGLPDTTKRLEAAYRDARYPSWDIVLELANSYQDAVLGGNADPSIVARHQMLRGRMAEFPATLAALNDFIGFFLKIAKADKSLPVDYFIQIGGYFPLMFMNFSDSVWLAAENPVYLLANYRAPVNLALPAIGEAVPPGRNVFTLSVLELHFSEEAILEIHRKTSEVNRKVNALPLK